MGDPVRFIEAVDAFCRTSIDPLVQPDNETDLRVRATAYVADRLSQARRNASDHIREALENFVARQAGDAAETDDAAERERLLSLFGAWPQVGRLRNDAAEALLQAQRLQQAELLLLRNRTNPDGATAARARALLTEIYTKHNLHLEAAANLHELAIDYGNEPTGNGLTGKKFLDQFLPDHPAKRVLRRHRSMPLPAYHVRITEHVCDERCETAEGCPSTLALRQHDRIRRKFLLGDDATLTLIDRGIVPGDRNHSQLTLLNRETGELHAEFRLPAAYWQLAAGHDRRCGQLLPTCGRTAHGLSLLEQRPVWSTEDSATGSPRDKVKLGPLGTDYCVLQTPRRLSVVHPGTGQTIWERSNLPPNTGLLANESTGIIGDAETLTLFGEDQRSYTVYRMHSGCTVRHGQLDVAPSDARRYRHAIGANLVHLDAAGECILLSVWDSGSDRLVCQEPLRDELFYPLGSGSRYALINREGRFRVVDVTTGTVEVDVPVPDEHLTDVTDLVVTSDRDHYFVNLVGCSDDTTSETSAAMDEVEVPGVRVRGLLMAVSKQNRLLWQQPVTEAVLLTNTECAMPVLTLISRVRDVQNRQASRLRVDVLDVGSGQTLARRDDLLRTRIVGTRYDHRPGRLTLVGLNSRIDVEFGPRRREFLIHAEVDRATDTLVR